MAEQGKGKTEGQEEGTGGEWVGNKGRGGDNRTGKKFIVRIISCHCWGWGAIQDTFYNLRIWKSCIGYK